MLEPKVGQIVTSIAGRDRENKYIIVGKLPGYFVLVADGQTRRTSTPKRKNVKHLALHQEVATEVVAVLDSGEEISDDLLRKALKRLTNSGA